ncbi:MAG: ImmA/IrrE family metallo-endopeptidase [Planctomycetota bacterium]
MSIARAVNAADRLIVKLQISEPPVDVEWVARQLDVSVVYKPLEETVSGVLVKQGEQASIGVNALHHTNRQRFTVAHEIAHHILHPNNPTVFVDQFMIHFRDGTAPASPMEDEANAFAAALLMPARFLRGDFATRKIDASDETAVRSLAQRYGVSPQALTIRLVHLGYLRGYSSQ